MLLKVLTVIVPIFFVVLLGFAAGRAKAFNRAQVSGINALVLNFALPASLFVGTVRTPRDQLLQQIPLFLTLLISVLVPYAATLVVGRALFHRTLTEATLQALSVSFSAGSFFGPALVSGIYGPNSALAISLMALVLNVVVVPTSVVLLEVSRASGSSGPHARLGAVIASALATAIKTPYVWASILAIILVLLGVRMPLIVDSSLDLIGNGTSGAALFVAGIIIAANKLTVNVEIVLNTVIKMLGQPALYIVVALAFNLAQPYGHEGLLLSGLPTGPMAVLLATQYNAYESQASSTIALTTVALMFTLPIALYRIGGQ